MMRSLFSGVSGLKNHQTRMDVIGNNISNVNTTGFKSSRVAFTDMLSQNLSGASSPNDNVGGSNPKQIGLGSAVGAVDLLFTNGSVQSTGVNTDLALSSSNALFILDTGGGTAYTRNGDFQFDADGNYVQAGNGYYVQGWMADKSGALNTNSKVTNITIPSGKSMDPTASATATYTNNLNAEVPTIVKIAGGTGSTTSTTPREYTKSTDGTMTATAEFPVIVATKGGEIITKADLSDPYKPTDGTYRAESAFKVTVDQAGDKVTVADDNTIIANIDGGGTATAKLDGGKTKWTFNGVPGIADGTTYVQNKTEFEVLKADEIDTGTTPAHLKIKSFEVSSEITDLKQDYVESASGTADNSVTLTLSDGSTITQTSGKYSIGESLPIVTTLSVYDTLGSLHELTVYFTLTSAKDDTWRVSLTDTGENTIEWKEADGSKTTASMAPVTLDFDTFGAFASGSGKTTLTLTNGSTTPQTISIDFSQLTQYSSSSTIAGKADGNAAGILSSISIDKSGVITGTYTNGEKRAEAQIALQRFTNPGGLNKIGESLYEESNNSGKSGEPGTASALGATITPSALEMSNVDVANEFTDMIITQRGFQTNSKIITVSDEMLETIVNMKR
ncbi:MAG: flagellar hook-basal body complex protein [Schwartzia sp.]|nr:flagellar hook-basal body complex protein [Schwartzia sp. (in: firmicutes)]